MVNYLEEVSNFIFTSKYARYNEDLGRRETWEEAVARVEAMHLKKYSFLPKSDLKKIAWAFDLVREKRVVPSMRSLQFGGKAIEAQNPRMFNCSVTHIHSIRSFAESFYLLLCGCGVGFGLSKHFLSRLPNLVTSEDKNGTVITYVVQDTIEGWADSVEALLSCYFKNTALTGRKIVFDYSKIRPKGALLKTGGGKAPGYLGLKRAHQKIKTLLDYIIEERNQSQMRAIHAYDILMHCADAVLSGGVRRSACAVIFDKDDKEMMEAKTEFAVDKHTKFGYDDDVKLYHGKVTVSKKKYEVNLTEWEHEHLLKTQKIGWYHIEPQRARSNNSILLLRNEVTREELVEIIEFTKQFGEPGFVFGDHPHTLYNPCVTGNTEILTKNGFKEIQDCINQDLEIWNGFEWSIVTPKITGHNQPILKIKCSDGRELTCTNYHNWIISENYHGDTLLKRAIDLKIGDKIPKYNFPVLTSSKQLEHAYTQGFISGDGMEDYDLLWLYEPKFACQDKLTGGRFVGSELENINGIKRKCFKLDFIFERKDFVPMDYSLESKLNWLAGIFDSDGCELKEGGCQIVSINDSFLIDLQKLLVTCGVQSKIVHSSDEGYRDLPDGKGGTGKYFCQASKRICIGAQAVQNLKGLGLSCARLKFSKSPNRDAGQYTKIISIEDAGVAPIVYCLNEPKKHLAVFNGILTSQCYEVGFLPVTTDGVCGVQFCNLTTMNGRLVTSVEIFEENVEAYTIIGTLQAGYTHFPYLSNAAKELTEGESLLGCSITGMMDNPDILLNPEIQTRMAKFAVKVNKEWAAKIGINQAARITVLKPEGTSSLLLGTGSGIHPHHARKYFRRVQNNKLDNVYRFFKKQNPHACEQSVWSANHTDDIITFPIEVSEKAMVKSDLTALRHLEIIKSTQQNWIKHGLTEANKKPVTHNVSCTVMVKEEEWDGVIDYLFLNRDSFSAVALLPSSGDKSYQQAPMEAISTKEDEEKWIELVSKMKPVNYKLLEEEEDKTSLSQEGACYGGACQII